MILTPSDEIAIGGVISGVLAIVVAVWCVYLSLRTNLKITTLITIRDELIQAIDGIEMLLREIPDHGPYDKLVVQKISNCYWQAKHQFEEEHNKAQIILPPNEISPWSKEIPNVEAAYNRFAEAMHKDIIQSAALNDFKAAFYVAVASLEHIISRRLLHFYQMRSANDLFQSRQRVIEEIRNTNVTK